MNTSFMKETNEKLIESKEMILSKWIDNVLKKSLFKKGLFTDSEIMELCHKILFAFLKIIEIEDEIILNSTGQPELKAALKEYSKIAVNKGMNQVEVSTFIFSLKSIVFDFINEIAYDDMKSLAKETMRISEALDKMGLFTFDLFVKEREEVIIRQQEDMIELSTPVIRVWDSILEIPLIGTLDSKRTQMIMEKLLDMIVTTSAQVAIIDITGIPAVDTLVANHLLKTANATRLLGAELIITGISPAIAQTMVHLGVDLSGITTRAVMADGIRQAMDLAGFKVVKSVKG